MKSFEFATAGRIVFGAGTFAQLDGIAATLGKRPLIVTGKRPSTSSTLRLRRLSYCWVAMFSGIT